MEGSRTFWNDRAQNYLKSKLNSEVNTNKAKNVIFFIGDGMSIPTVAATRSLLGKEETQLSFEKFPHYGLTQTFCVDVQTPDSACTATAYFSGVKTNNRLLGINANVLSRQCVVQKEDHVESIFSWAQRSNKSTGIVTTTRITHASPAAGYAHVAHRDWENNAAITTACRSVENVTDIAYQLVYNEVAQKMKVFLGGGRRNFINTNENDDEGRPGLRTDGKNLIDEWVTERSKAGNAKYLWHKQQLDEVDFKKTDYLLGLFESDHCMYNLDIENNNLQHQEPSLTDMTVAAIKMLENDENGYFLFVEGGRIDTAHHGNLPQKSLEDTKEFAKAIDIARQMTDMSDTLIVVSSDHSHAFTFNGYPERNQNVLGIAELSDEDGKPYETLSYANGPGYPTTFGGVNMERLDISEQDFKNPARRYSATVPLSSETHAAEDVGVFASGPWSHLFTGSYGQHSIPVMMAYAAKIGPFSTPSTADESTTTTSEQSSPSTQSTSTTDSASSISMSILIFSMNFILILSLLKF